MSRNGCHNTQRGGTHSYTVQDGWRLRAAPGGVLTREPVMVEISTSWIDIDCGALAKDRSQACEGCRNNRKEDA